MVSSFSQPNSFLAISLESPSTAISRTRPNSRQLTAPLELLVIYSLGTDPTENTVLYDPAFFMRVLLLRALDPAGKCFPTRCLAMDLYVTI
jgi:hypothetical protein